MLFVLVLCEFSSGAFVVFAAIILKAIVALVPLITVGTISYCFADDVKRTTGAPCSIIAITRTSTLG